ncbi:MAG: DNA polymerase III subunit chi [Ramlibacter sp.]|nr:DNA polymerase III subunit chi [Ramlibacter sp.]
MTDVEFHFNAPDKLVYACRLLRKAVRSGSKVVVIAAPEMVRELDAALWTFDAHSFVPHCVVQTAPASMLGVSPIVLADSAQQVPHTEVLLNLGDSVPAGFERFVRLIEVVSLDGEDRVIARRRWKHYADRGYAIERKDLEVNGS